MKKVIIRSRALGLLLAIVELFCTTEAFTQERDSLVLKPELNLDFNTEQQLTHEGRYNCANLLRLSACLPIRQGWSAEIASISTFMTSAESIGDDFQTFSNIDAERIPFALAVCGISWTYTSSSRKSRAFAVGQNAGASHSLFLGIRNMNEDYFTSPVTSFFTNSSCGIYPTISANYPIANYPVASVGIHYKYENKNENENENNSFIFQASLYNGTGYNRFTGRENIFRVCPKSDGVFGIAQIEYNHCGSSYFLGSSAYYNKEMSITPWLYTEQKITSCLSMLAGYSHAFATDAECKDFVGLGLYYQRKKCEFGIHSDYAHFANANELATELTFKYTITNSFYIQPILHIISTSSEDSSCRRNVGTVASLRIGISL